MIRNISVENTVEGVGTGTILPFIFACNRPKYTTWNAAILDSDRQIDTGFPIVGESAFPVRANSGRGVKSGRFMKFSRTTL